MMRSAAATTTAAHTEKKAMSGAKTGGGKGLVAARIPSARKNKVSGHLAAMAPVVRWRF